MRYLRKNTDTRITVGPFFDKTDGITPEIALTVTNEKLTFMVDNGGVPTLVLDTAPTASGGSNDMVHVTNDDAGFYDLELAAANVNYLGRAMLALTDAVNHCPVFHEFMILPAVVYDALVLGTDNLDVSVADLAANSITASAIATDAIDADALKADAVTEIQSGLATAAALTAVDDFIDTEVAAILAAVDTEVAAIKAKTDNLPTAPADDTSIDTQLATIAGYLDTEVAAIKAKTDNLPTDPADESLLEAAIAAAHATTNGKIDAVDDFVDTEVAAILAAVDTEVGSIKAKTDNLPTAPADDTSIDTQLATIAGYLDTEVAAIKAKTDNLPTDPADESLLEAAISAVSGLDAAGVRSAVGLAAANLDTQLSNILDLGGAGSGAITWVYNLKDNLGAPVADATIWVTSDLAGANVLASGLTDAYGNATFYLDAGVVYVWGAKSGYNFINPDLETVS